MFIIVLIITHLLLFIHYIWLISFTYYLFYKIEIVIRNVYEYNDINCECKYQF